MKKSLRYFISILVIIILAFSACKKWPDSPQVPVDQKLMDNLVVAENFDWKTTKTVTISIKLPEADPTEVIRIYTEDLSELLYIGYGNASTNEINTKITTPTHLSAATIYYGYNNRYVPVLVGFDDALTYDYNLSLKSASADCGCEGGLQTLTMQYNGNTSASIKVVEKKGDVVIFENTIQPEGSFSFTGSKSNGKMDKTIYFYVNGTLNTTMQVDCKYNLYKGDTFGDFTIISGTSDNELPLCKATTECGCDGGLVTLTLRYTGTEAANIKVMSKQGNYWKTDYCGTVESNGEFTFNGDGKDGRLDNNLDLYINNVKNTSIHTSCSEPIEIGFTYGDFKIVKGFNKNNLSLCGEIEDVPPGGTDPGDDPGNDNTTTTSTGTLAFEDLWPSKGDYDFNDLVISYNFVVSKDNQDRILNISSTFIIHAFGASFHNGFGFQLPNVNNNQIISVSGSDIAPGSIFTLASNGLEQGQDKATIIVYDDSYRLMAHPGVGIGVNTVENAPYVMPDTISMNIVFYQNGSFAAGGAVNFTDLDIGNFNPFIVVKQERGREVHLPDFAPTSLVNEELFNTYNDDSNPSINRYYKSGSNLPWAINIPEVFNYPYEKCEIVKAYLKFAQWAESSGTVFQDWYQDNEGYRNNTFIYTHN